MAVFGRIVSLTLGYLCGSFLTADVVSRLLGGVTVFELGDGNPGMANVGKVLGRRAALACLAGDILKTVIAVVASRVLFPDLGVAGIAWAGLGSTLGHDFPFWHGFRGGKGVTTIASTIILMAPLWGVLAGVVGVGAIALVGYLSIAAMVAIVFYAVAAWFVLPVECFVVSLAFVGLSLYGHWSKLVGIADGTTHKSSLFKKGRGEAGALPPEYGAGSQRVSRSSRNRPTNRTTSRSRNRRQ